MPTSVIVIGTAVGVAAAMALESRRSGELRRVVGQSPTEGATTALAALPTVLAGVPLAKASTGSPLDTLKAQQRALVAANGAVSGVLTAYAYPRMRVSDLLALVDAWMDAFEAGRDVDADTVRDFALVDAPFPAYINNSNLEWQNARAGRSSTVDPSDLTDLGRYLFDLVAWRERELRASDEGDDVAPSTREASAAQVVGTWDRLRRFVGGIEGVSYVFPWARPSDQDPLKHVPGAVGAATEASGEFVAGVAGDALGLAGDLVASFLRQPLLWVGGVLLVGGVLYVAVRGAG